MCTRKLWLFYGIYSVALKLAVFFDLAFLIGLNEVVIFDLFLIFGRDCRYGPVIGQIVVILKVFSEVHAELLRAVDVEMYAGIISVRRKIDADLFGNSLEIDVLQAVLFSILREVLVPVRIPSGLTGARTRMSLIPFSSQSMRIWSR